jgi:hypothetical protein
MQSFDELNALYRDFRTRNRNYALQAAQFVRDFAYEFANLIGAQRSFRRPTDNKDVPYIRPLKFDADPRAFDLLEPFDYLEWDDDTGKWLAGIGVHLEPAKNAFPKTEFQVELQFRLLENAVDLEIPPNGTFQIDLNDRSSWQGALEHIAGELARTLKLKPWETSERTESIGFVWFGKD